MPVTTNLETVKISELAETSSPQGKQTLATNPRTNQSMALDLTAVYDATVNANNAATQAGLAATQAREAAQAADKAREDIQEDLAGKADLDEAKKYVNPSQLDPLYGYQTGAVMGKGAFASTAEGVLPDGDFGIAVLFTTGVNVTSLQGVFLNHSSTRNIEIIISAGYIYLQRYGKGYARKEASANTMYLVVVSYDTATDTPTMWVNGVKIANFSTEKYPVETPDIFRLGIGNTSSMVFNGSIHCARLLNFCSDTYSIDMWNSGHPELWRVPDVYRNLSPSKWPTGIWLEASGTWARNYSIIVYMPNQPVANGFSGSYARFERGTAEALSLYNRFRSDNPDELARYQLIEFEYRSNVHIRAKMGEEIYANYPANTDNAKTVSYIAPAGKYTALTQVGNDTDAWLEIRTLRIMTLGCLLDLTPAGLLPTLWRDMSGQGNDVPYVPTSGNPTNVEFSYENVGYSDVLTGIAAPSIAPNFVGQTYIDTQNKNVYKATGTSSAADWKNI